MKQKKKILLYNFENAYLDFNQCPESQEKSCRRFRDIFPTHTDLCEKLYPNDFKVVLNDEPCMVMWFPPGTDNPNDKVRLFQWVKMFMLNINCWDT